MNIVTTSGKRKKAIARATIRKGMGIIRLNHQLLDSIEPEYLRMRIMEPIMLADKFAQTVDIDVNVSGGGVTSQAEAVRLAVARAMVKYSEDTNLEKIFENYDRHLLVADVRRKEAKKPNTNSKARAKKQKSYR